MGELGSYNTAVSVWSCHLAPDDSDFRSLSLACGFVDERYSLSEVEPAISSQPYVLRLAMMFLVLRTFLQPILHRDLDGLLTVRLLNHRHPRS